MLAYGPENTRESIDAKLHAVYFEEYFNQLQARTIVVEDGYVDHDFLEDFAAYYVRCFQPYSRYCRRLHFFTVDIEPAEFRELLRGDLQKCPSLQQGYLGFIVVRPIPQRVIGRTCLATYPIEDGREFPAARTQQANLFGISLTVRTIPFQEQDRAVAACATSALWSMFQGTGRLFQHRIPSPAEITQQATATNPLDGRAFPAGDGLMFVQMADAVRSCDLEPLWVMDTYPEYFFASIRAHLSEGIPLLLNGDVLERDDLGHQHGVHAVAITGYRLSDERAEPESDGFLMRSSRIQKLYAHDDGVGPFARMEFIATTTKGWSHARPASCPVLSTSQCASNDTIGNRVFCPDALLIPLYHKIRVPFLRIYSEIRAFDNYLKCLVAELSQSTGSSSGSPGTIDDLEWDIRLTTVNKYKTECLTRNGLRDREILLTTSLPRYLWLASGVHRDGSGLDLLFDATGLELSNLCLRFVDAGSPVILLLQSLAGTGQSVQYSGCDGVLTTVVASTA
ncbi:hypothetical protein [Sorangium sp. So ce381]|uniref:hypothetical protein n=1 Tax=Sorangium sp. So ce381 TaxID=3133307 RepID=UPI003F5C127F